MMMTRALQLARRGLYTTSPNPRVGCVMTRAGEIVGEGWHQQAGGPHAEIHALAMAGELARGATAYVTLEPCSHTGKTGPCADALIKAGVTRVVYAMEDPNPEVAGRGLERLRSAGIQVDGPVLEDQAESLNPGFIRRMETGKPYVRCKMAMSLDGRTAMASGESKWVTGPKARSDVQRLRARSCAIITGIDSILHDDSSLTVRPEEMDLTNAEAAAEKQPLRVVVDTQLRLSPKAKILSGGGPVVLFASEQAIAEKPAEVKALDALGVVLSPCPLYQGKLDLRHILEQLAQSQCNEILIEAGATLAGAFLRRGLIDELTIYMASKLLGSQARPLFDLPLQSMAAQLPLKISDIRALGNDWRITARPDPEG